MKRVPISLYGGEISGYNCGCYPLHHFSCSPEADDPVLRPLLAVQFTGGDEWIEGCYRKRVNSSLYSIELIREGNMYFTQEGQRTLTVPGDVILVRRGVDNEMETGPVGFCYKQVLCVTGTLLESVLTQTALCLANVITLQNPEPVYALMLKAGEILGGRAPGYQMSLSDIVFSVLQHLASEVENSAYPVPLTEALGVLNRSVSNGISLKQLGEEVGASPQTLCRMFRKYLETSPLEYFLKLRMGFAANLLRNTGFSIKEIAATCGYANQLYFSAQFRTRMGLSPREYRRNLTTPGRNV